MGVVFGIVLLFVEVAFIGVLFFERVAVRAVIEVYGVVVGRFDSE